MPKKTPIKKEYKNFLMFLCGLFTLVLGITLVLLWWEDLIQFLRGITGFLLALGGLLILYSIKK